MDILWLRSLEYENMTTNEQSDFKKLVKAYIEKERVTSQDCIELLGEGVLEPLELVQSYEAY